MGVEAIITDYLNLLGLKAPPPSLCPTDYKQKKKQNENRCSLKKSEEMGYEQEINSVF